MYKRQLNTPRDRRQSTLDESLAGLPYVNGGLFAAPLPVAHFNTSVRDALLEATRFDWSRISPAVFGALFQGVMEPRARRQIGLFTALLLTVSTVIVGLIIYTMTIDKKKAIATLKLIGAPDRRIVGLIVQQAVAMGVISFLAGAALIILIASPEALFEISFQLSFSAVLAILYAVEKLGKRQVPLPSATPRWIAAGVNRLYLFLLVSAAATLGTLPIIAFYFNRVSAVALIANLVAVPLLGILALIPAMMFILTSVFSAALAGFFISIASFFTGIAVSIIEELALLPWSSLSFIKPNALEIALFYAFMYFLIEALTTDRPKDLQDVPARRPLWIKTGLLVCAALILADAAFLVLKDQFSSHLKITAIDVGQGSSALVRMPGGVNMLIDGGGFHDSSFDVGRAVIAPFLYAKRIRKVDIAVLTHPHPDHLQGLIHIVNAFDVREVWCAGLTADNDLYRLWEKTVAERGVKVRTLSAQSPPEVVSGVTFQFLWPLRPPPPGVQGMSYQETNDASLVIKMTYGARRFLVTGDISAAIEAFLTASGKDLKSDVLFVPHHGSLSSSSPDFLRVVSCRYAVISAGKNNVFRHPHPAVLERYRSCLLYTSPSPRDRTRSRMPSSA